MKTDLPFSTESIDCREGYIYFQNSKIQPAHQISHLLSLPLLHSILLLLCRKKNTKYFVVFNQKQDASVRKQMKP